MIDKNFLGQYRRFAPLLGVALVGGVLLIFGLVTGRLTPEAGEGASPTRNVEPELSKDDKGDGSLQAELSQSEAEAAAAAELKIEDMQLGKGEMADMGKTLTVHYRALLDDGTVVDDTHKGKGPFKFILGEGKVIAAWDKGLSGMKVGGKRKLVTPPALAYGKRGISGVVPPQATLSFEVELVAVE